MKNGQYMSLYAGIYALQYILVKADH